MDYGPLGALSPDMRDEAAESVCNLLVHSRAGNLECADAEICEVLSLASGRQDPIAVMDFLLACPRFLLGHVAARLNVELELPPNFTIETSDLIQITAYLQRNVMIFRALLAG